MRVADSYSEGFSVETGLRRNGVSRGNGHSADEEGWVWIELIPCIVSGYAVLAVRICACLFHSPGAEPVYAYPEG